MALPPPSAARKPLHRRAIEIEAFQRDDGLFDLEARLTDAKTYPIELIRGPLGAGEPIHDMTLRITIDAALTVVAVQACSDAVPVPGSCDAVNGAYGQMVGLNLLSGFRRAVKARLGGTRGCTHLTELTGVLPTAALQAIGHVVRHAGSDDPSLPPFFIGQCHTYDRAGEVVRQHYPQWFVQAN
jgi:hypothetical protein